MYVLLSTCPYGELSYQEFMDGWPDNKAHKSATKAAKERDSRNPKTIFGGGFVVVVGHNGGRDLQIINWFEESLAGRQCNGRQPDFRHGRPLDI